MALSDFSRQLRKSILIHSTMSILIIGLAVSLVSISFLYFKIKSELTNNLLHYLRIRTMTVEEFINRTRDIAMQITSRTKLRQKLEDYNRGEISLAELTEFSAPLLSDAMKQSREIAGISRLDAKNRLAVSIGIAVPSEVRPVPETAGERVLIRGPIALEGNSFIVLGASILGEGNRRVGTDVILFDTGNLLKILRNDIGLGKKGETFLGIPSGDGVRLLSPSRAEGEYGQGISTAPSVSEAFKYAFSKKSGIAASDPSSIIAYGPLSHTDWALAVRMDRGELYAPMYRQVFVMAVIILFLLLGGYYGMIIVLRPLTKNILIKADDLERQIQEKTAQLETFTAELREEKTLLTSKNRELEKAYEDLKAAQSQILQQEKMASIGQLAAGVAHEINNPMGFIISNLNTLGKYTGRLFEVLKMQEEALSVKDAAALQRLCARIEEKRAASKLDYITEDTANLIRESLDGAERVKRIVQDLKNFSRIDETEWKEDDINAGLESTVNIVWNELKYKATVRKGYGKLPLIRCNVRQLNQVFMNILLNAAHALEKPGEIEIETWCDERQVYVSISDSGCGIPAENLGRIFDPFFTTKEVGKGTGLGLSIAYDIVKKHNGTIEVCSEVGKGTTFIVKLPLTNNAAAA